MFKNEAPDDPPDHRREGFETARGSWSADITLARNCSMVSTCLTVFGTAFLKLFASLALNFKNANGCGIPLFLALGSNASDTMDDPFDGNVPTAFTLDIGTVTAADTGFLRRLICRSKDFLPGSGRLAMLDSIFLIKNDRAPPVNENLKDVPSTHAVPILSASVTQNILLLRVFSNPIAFCRDDCTRQ